MAIPCIWSWHLPSLKDDVVTSHPVKTALELGYRAIDTAHVYDNRSRGGSGYRRKRRAA